MDMLIYFLLMQTIQMVLFYTFCMCVAIKRHSLVKYIISFYIIMSDRPTCIRILRITIYIQNVRKFLLQTCRACRGD